MKEHATFGAKILGDHVWLSLAKSIALSQYERWDEGGYPRDLIRGIFPLKEGS